MSMDVSMAERIRFWRKRVGISQMQFAINMGVSLSTVRNWERGVGPSMGRLAAIQSALGVSQADFLTTPLPVFDTAANG